MTEVVTDCSPSMDLNERSVEPEECHIVTDISRINNICYCSCSECKAMYTAEESVCCKEMKYISAISQGEYIVEE